jgi:RimK family alpha-L-glutamate ligase
MGKLIFLVNNKRAEPAFLSNFKKLSRVFGHKFTHIEIEKCAFSYTRNKNEVNIFYKGKKLDVNNSIWFIRRWAPSEDTTALLCTILENKKVFFTDTKVNAQHEIKTSKLSQTFQLAYANCPSPSTWVVPIKNYALYKQAIIRHLAFPIIMKTRGGQGQQVWKCDTSKDLDIKIAEIVKKNVDDLCIFQEFIENQGDIRVVVFNNTIITAIHRFNPDHFLHNTSQGAVAKKVSLSPIEKKIAINATKKIGLTLAGVDIVQSKHGPLVYEVNKAPDINELTGKNIDVEIIKQFIADFASQ